MQVDDQGLVNTDPRTIAVPLNFVNMISTDVHGLTFDRTPQMVRRFLFLLYPSLLKVSTASFKPIGR
jgi:hypothetical protein